jgi:hypothetical protein
VAGCCECGDEPLCSCVKELVNGQGRRHLLMHCSWPKWRLLFRRYNVQEWGPIFMHYIGQSWWLFFMFINWPGWKPLCMHYNWPAWCPLFMHYDRCQVKGLIFTLYDEYGRMQKGKVVVCFKVPNNHQSGGTIENHGKP